MASQKSGDHEVCEEECPVFRNSSYDTDMALADREAKWGFTLEELQAATKVARTLFYNPALYVGDPYLSDSRLYTMITRDRKTKRANVEVMKAIMNEEKSRKKRHERLQNLVAVQRTVMKRERDEALGTFLLGDQQQGPANPLLLCDSATATSRAADPEAGQRWSEEEKDMLRLVGAFENLLRLEQVLAGTLVILNEAPEAPKPFSTATTAHAPQSASHVLQEEGAVPKDTDWAAITQLTAQVYRYLPHPYGTQMPTPLFPGAPAQCGAGGSGDREAFLQPAQLQSYISGAKVLVARRAVESSLPQRSRHPQAASRRRLEEGAEMEAEKVAPAPDTPVSIRRFIGLTDSDVVVRGPVEGLRSIGTLRQWVAEAETHGTCSEETVAAGAEEEKAVVETCGDLLRGIEVVLLEGGTDDRLRPSSAGCTTRDVAEQSLNLFIARRLYRSARVRDAGESPLVVQRRPPTYDSEEPDSDCVFEDAQLFSTENHHQDHALLQLATPRGCHTCRVRFNQLHPYYYSMCHLCAEFNFNKRLMARDLRGTVVLLTGCRIKIGYAMALSLLRCGATLLGTTRFAHEAAARFQQESDYEMWKDRLHLFSLDLRDMWVVTQFCAFVRQKYPKLLAIINNAAQTIARTPQYTEHLRAIELSPSPALRQAIQDNAAVREWHEFFLRNTSVTVGEPLTIEHRPHEQPFLPIGASAPPQQMADCTSVPEGGDGGESGALAIAASETTRVTADRTLIFDRYDTQAEQSDERETNSWVMRLAEVQGGEAAEVMAINALSPFILNSKLKPCLLNREGDASPNEPRFIINVSAMEGQFYRFKQVTHPHTNMAKAALNMMTRTSAADYAQDSIYMNSVDTGWITDESPKSKKERRAEQELLCPLDEVDAAARCLDLIYTNSREYGKFFKDFKEIPW